MYIYIDPQYNRLNPDSRSLYPRTASTNVLRVLYFGCAVAVYALFSLFHRR